MFSYTYLGQEPLKPGQTAGLPPYIFPTWCHTVGLRRGLMLFSDPTTDWTCY